MSSLRAIFFTLTLASLLLLLAADSPGFRLQATRSSRYRKLSRQLLSKDRDIGKQVGYLGGYDYVLELAIGTPPKSVRLIIDTGSDLIWAQSKNCARCFTLPDQIFDPKNSSSFTTLSCFNELCRAVPNFKCQDTSCRYGIRYGDDSTSVGALGLDTFTFGSVDPPVKIPNITFGSGTLLSGSLYHSSGILGLGRGPLSLISQLKLSRFSYCFDGEGGPVFFGSLAKLIGGKKVYSTPLLQSTLNPTFYYLSLEGITVGETLLPIPPSTFELKEDGSGGTIVDSGTAILRLNDATYHHLSTAFTTQLGLPAVDGTFIVGLRLCFRLPRNKEVPKIPRLIFHFKGADWNVPQENYIERYPEADLICVEADKSLWNTTVIGIYATENMHVVYDLKMQKLSLIPTKCSEF